MYKSWFNRGGRCFSIAPKKHLTCEISVLYLVLLQFVLSRVQNAGRQVLPDLADEVSQTHGDVEDTSNLGRRDGCKTLAEGIQFFGAAPALNTLMTKRQERKKAD